ncbi:MAG: glycosyltransferase family 4 protein [Patescibacteria group bacterium]|mgnify:CR=1 FL=1
MHKKLIALVRGTSLNACEIQYYLPLLRHFSLLAVTSKGNPYPPPGFPIPVSKLWCPGDLLGSSRYGIELLRLILGDTQYLYGLDQALSGVSLISTIESYLACSYQTVRFSQKEKLGGKNIPVVVTANDNLPFIHEDTPIMKRHKYFVLENADHFVAITEAAKKVLIKEGVDGKKISIIPQALDVKLFSPAKNKKIKGVFTILALGRLTPEKGFAEVIAACHFLKNEFNKKFKLIICGEGADRNRLEQLVHKLNLSGFVEFLDGGIPYEKLPDVYRNADCLVHAAGDLLDAHGRVVWQEQFGRILIEAMGCGIPVVATDSGAVPEVLGGYGILINPNQPQILAREISRIIDSPKLRTAEIRKNLIFVRKTYAIEKISWNLINLYSNLLNG